jgi:hypothetical protein
VSKQTYAERNRASIEKFGLTLYERRIQKGLASGKTRSASRGHGKERVTKNTQQTSSASPQARSESPKQHRGSRASTTQTFYVTAVKKRLAIESQFGVAPSYQFLQRSAEFKKHYAVYRVVRLGDYTEHAKLDWGKDGEVADALDYFGDRDKTKYPYPVGKTP